MMRTARKDIRELIETATEAGFVFDRYTGSGHYKMHHPDGGSLVIPSTPSGSRWKQNVLADIRRAERKDPS